MQFEHENCLREVNKFWKLSHTNIMLHIFEKQIYRALYRMINIQDVYLKKKDLKKFFLPIS